MVGMRELEAQLVELGWSDLGGGWWSHHQVDNADTRFELEGAVLREFQRKENRIDALTTILDKIRKAFAWPCSYSEMPAVASKEAAADAVEKPPKVFGPKKGMLAETFVRIAGEEITKDIEREMIGLPPTCPKCKVLMTATSDALGNNPKWLCVKCDRIELRCVLDLTPDGLGGGELDKHICGNCDLPMTPIPPTSDRKSGWQCEDCGRTVIIGEALETKSPAEEEAAKRYVGAARGAKEGPVKKKEQVLPEGVLSLLELSTMIRGHEEWIRAEEELVKAADKIEEDAYAKQTRSGDGPCAMPPSTLRQTWHAMLSNRKRVVALGKQVNGLHAEIEAVKAGVDKLSEDFEGFVTDKASHEQAIGALMCIVSELLDKTGMQVAQKYWKIMKKWTA